MEDKEIAACGLICSDCSIYKASEDEECAEKVKDWFVEMGWVEKDISLEEFMDRGPYCLGCHGPREKHWSPDCWIKNCCIDSKGLENCSRCEEFPCKGLEEWADEDVEYTAALENLKRLRKDREESDEGLEGSFHITEEISRKT